MGPGGRARHLELKDTARKAYPVFILLNATQMN